MKIAIVRYNAGNVQSVTNALNRLGVKPILTDDGNVLQSADKVIFPGVGEASSAMDHLRRYSLDSAILSLKQPMLAICLGMHLLCESSKENDATCLGIFPYRVELLCGEEIKVPHMGWNNISNLRSPLFAGVEEGSRVYFAHSYFVESADQSIADVSYGQEFSAALNHNNFYGLQFHPEKSGSIGTRILENFLNL